ncbi:uncharacterized protein LOC114520181 [Dendronephthya gigantea]|uniref:uncharacterized protein LOC114520181 n=1 Tax=Dendronephthya gigantea TaxID=151771 RepID=UPI001069C045|nr:uncharacterized protein LOC114520181 [Dendronephthya gigantea]
MNCLIGDKVFPSSNQIDVCTKGVHVASVMHRIENSGCAFFVDTEGQGDEGIESDATLLTPILLLSKVILFNWKGGLQKNNILNELGLLVEVASRVSSNSLERPKFGHLHIVLRDFHFEGTDEEALAKIFDEEMKRGEDVNQRNKVREKLRSSFESIKVFTLPTPSGDVSNLDLRTTSEEFQTRIEELKSIISGQLKEPRSFGNFVVNFENVDDLVKTFAQNLENGDIVNVKSVVRQLQRGTVDKAKRCFEENLIKAYKVINTPVKQDLEEHLIKKSDALLGKFRRSTAQVDLEKEYVNSVLQDLKTWASMRLKDKVEAKEKEEKSNQQIRLMKAVEDFRWAVEVELQRQEETDVPSLRKTFQQKKRKIIEIFQNSTSGLHLVTQCTEEELRMLESWTARKFEEKVEAVEKEERQRKSGMLLHVAFLL